MMTSAPPERDCWNTGPSGYHMSSQMLTPMVTSPI